VLIVEDDEELRPMLETLLQTEGYETMSVVNGQEALDRLAERLPCLVLLDIFMPVMDGYQFRARQLRDPRIATVPVLCVSGVFDVDEVVRRTGVNCLRKPTDPDRLLREIRSTCGEGFRPS
jgi:CheY-like chemotaxis protein